MSAGEQQRGHLLVGLRCSTSITIPSKCPKMCLRLNPGILSASQTLGFTDLNITGVRLTQIRWPSAARHRPRTYATNSTVFRSAPVGPVGVYRKQPSDDVGAAVSLGARQSPQHRQS